MSELRFGVNRVVEPPTPKALPPVLSDHIDCDALLTTVRELRGARAAIRDGLDSQESGIVAEALDTAAEAIFNAVNCSSAYLADHPAKVAIEESRKR